MTILALTVVLCGATYSVAHPDRDLQDRAAGTHLVPK